MKLNTKHLKIQKIYIHIYIYIYIYTHTNKLYYIQLYCISMQFLSDEQSENQLKESILLKFIKNMKYLGINIIKQV